MKVGHKTSKAVNLVEGQAGVKKGRGEGAERRQSEYTYTRRKLFSNQVNQDCKL